MLKHVQKLYKKHKNTPSDTLWKIIAHDLCKICEMKYFGSSICPCESLTKKDLILMNWVDYSGHIMVVQGYVSLQKSIGTQAGHKAALTQVPWDMTVHLWVRVGWLLQRGCSSAFGLFFLLCTDQTAPPFYTFKHSLPQHYMKHTWHIFLTPSLMSRTLADSFGNGDIWWDLHNIKYLFVFWTAIKRTTESSDCTVQSPDAQRQYFIS